METPTGVHKISENVLQENRALITTDSSIENFNNSPVGTILVDSDSGIFSLKLKGQTNWIPANIKSDNTICIIKDSAILSETFSIVSIDETNNVFKYSDGLQQYEGKIDGQKHFVFTLQSGSYIPNRNHLSAVLDGVLERTSADGSLTELDDTRFYIEDTLTIGQTVTALYINWMRIGNPYPRIFINKEKPTGAEVGDLWIDLEGDIDDGTYGDDDIAGGRHVEWANIDSKPTTIAGFKLTDAANIVHTHKISDITDFTTTTIPVVNSKNAQTANTLQGLVPGTTEPNSLVKLNSVGKIDASIIPNTYGFQIGMVMMWYGASNAIPVGWQVCDGTNGTPDLTGRFVLGVSSTHPLGQNTDSSNETVVLTQEQIAQHSHNIHGTTSIEGNHVHGGLGSQNSGGSWNGLYSTENQYCGTGSTDYDNWLYNTTTNGAHSHTVSITSEPIGSNQAHNNIPPYYALFYIMYKGVE